jgi:hypothetical protein
MKMLNYRQFESLDIDRVISKFPSLDEVKECFYEFTDDILCEFKSFEVGYNYFTTSKNQYVMRTDPAKEYGTEDTIDILNTNLSDLKLLLCRDSVVINKHIPYAKKNRLRTILSGEMPAYEFMSFRFDDPLFSEDKLPVLLSCLDLVCEYTEFRPYSCLWSESYLQEHSNLVEERIGFAGNFFRGSDENYLKISQIFTDGSLSPQLVKHFANKN